MTSIASMGLLAKLPQTPDRAAVLAKKAAQARARREKKKAGAVPPRPTPPETAKMIAATVQPAKRPNPAVKKAPQANLFPTEKTTPVIVPAARGGVRAGVGRKAVYAGKTMETVSFRATPEQRAEFFAAGGGDWVRAGLDERLAFKKAGKK